MNTYDAGCSTAYAAAVRGGYKGTYDEFCAQQAEYAKNAQDMEQSKTKMSEQAEAARTARNTAAQAAAVARVYAGGESQEWTDDAGTAHTERTSTETWNGADGNPYLIPYSARGYANQAKQEALYAEDRADEARAQAQHANYYKEAAAQSASNAVEQNRQAGLNSQAAAQARQGAEQAMQQSQNLYNNIGSETEQAISRIISATENAKRSIPDDYTTLQRHQTLLAEVVPGTVQSFEFSDGNVSLVKHVSGSVTVRQDAFTYGANTITEVRTLNSGERLTIITNLITLETTATYAAA